MHSVSLWTHAAATAQRQGGQIYEVAIDTDEMPLVSGLVGDRAFFSYQN
jgi:hypothetical protein